MVLLLLERRKRKAPVAQWKEPFPSAKTPPHIGTLLLNGRSLREVVDAGSIPARGTHRRLVEGERSASHIGTAGRSSWALSRPPPATQKRSARSREGFGRLVVVDTRLLLSRR